MPGGPLEFLHAVLPEEGCYCLQYPWRRGGKNPNKKDWVSSVDELWKRLQKHRDRDVFFRSCSFIKPDDADTENVLAKRAFYVDFDCDPDTAAEAVIENLVCKNNLPVPILICSGRGLHVWWALKPPVDLKQWERIAKGLRKACEDHNLPADHSGTGDIVRMGRCPGTFNHKHGSAREVRFYDEPSFAAHDLSRFADLAVDIPDEPPPSKPLPFNGDLALYQAALGHIPPPDNYNQAFLRGVELHSLGEAGFEMWWNWYSRGREAQSGSKCTKEQLRGHWNSFHDGREGDRGLGSLIHDAEQNGFDQRYLPPLRSNGEMLPNGEDQPAALNGFDAGDPLACHWHAMSGIRWIKIGKPQNEVIKQREYVNARKAVAEVRIEGKHDYFTNCREFKFPWEKEKGWQDYSNDKKQIVDNVRNYLCDRRYGDMGIENVERALKEVANYGSYNSIVDYLDGLIWDEEPRLDTWLIKYCGAADTPVNRAIGKLVLIAAVRRAKRPGSKFDHLLILEGNEGIGKSQTVLILAGGEKYFSDEPILTLDAKRQHELLEGKWFYEISEFHGIRRTESDHLKAFVTRNVDRSRKAYAHDCTSTFRTCVCIVTTNYVEDKYLQEEMGLRRFWPVKIGNVDQDFLIRGRDQLFAEAVIREKEYGYLDMPQDLQEQLRAEQEKRVIEPEFFDVLSSITGKSKEIGLGRFEETITTAAIKDRLGLPLQYHSTVINRKIAQAMKKLGWEPVQIPTGDDRNLRGWKREHAEKK